MIKITQQYNDWHEIGFFNRVSRSRDEARERKRITCYDYVLHAHEMGWLVSERRCESDEQQGGKCQDQNTERST